MTREKYDEILRDGGEEKMMREIHILRAALHRMAADAIGGVRWTAYAEQRHVNHYVAAARLAEMTET